MFNQRIYNFIQRLAYRRTAAFLALQTLLDYTPFEEVLSIAMNFVLYSPLEGDYLEFGVFEGRSFLTAFHFAQMRKLKTMRFYAFDSFQGLPRPEGSDVVDFCKYKEGDYAVSQEKFEKNLRWQGVDFKKITVVPGWYEKILTEETKKHLLLKKAAIIHIDCNLYLSTFLALNFITDYLQNGTIIIFDDWFAFKGHPEQGEQKAFRDWLKKNPRWQAVQFYRCGWGINSFVMNKAGDRN